MKALRAALEELEVVDPYAELERVIGDLGELADYAEENSGAAAGVSMESIIKSFKPTDYTLYGKAAQYHFAMEELSGGVWALIVAAAVAIIALLKKFYDWAFGKGSSKSGGGAVTSSIDSVVLNAKQIDEHNRQFIKLSEGIRQSEIQFEELYGKGKLATEEMSTNIAEVTGGRKYLETMEDVLALYLKEDADQNPAYQFVMVKRDAFSEDILNSGPYSKMTDDIIALIQNGQFSESRSQALHAELEKLMKDHTATDAEFAAFNAKLGDYDKIQTGGLGAKFGTVDELVAGAKKVHQDLVHQFVDGRASMEELGKKLQNRLHGSTMTHMTQASETVKKIIKESEQHYENYRIEASVMQHKEMSADRVGEDQAADKHRAAGQSMRHMSKFSRNMCELARLLFVYAKGLLKVMEMLRNAGLLTLRILNQYVMPKVKSEESKVRITGLAKGLKTALDAYSF